MIAFIYRRLLRPIQYAYNGLVAAYKTEEAFRIELYLSLGLFPLAFFLAQNTLEMLLLTLSIFIVLIVELLNTAIEKTIDRISKEHHPLSKIVKDVASAAVGLSLIQWAWVWGWILLQHAS